MASKCFAIWSQVPYDAIRFQNTPPGKSDIILQLIVTDIPDDKDRQDVIDKLKTTKHKTLLDQTTFPDEKIQSDFWPMWPCKWPLTKKSADPFLQLETEGLIVAWVSLG
jgi:hypothetical protein